MRVAAMVAAVLLLGCAGPAPTLRDFERVSDLCFERSQADRRAGRNDIMSRWYACTVEHYQPLELRFYHWKADEIRAIYAKLAPLPAQVDSGAMTVTDFYLAWDRLNEQARLPYCIVRAPDDQGGQCLQYWRNLDPVRRVFRPN